MTKLDPHVVSAVSHLFAELLDEAVPAGELIAIVRSVRKSLHEQTPLHSHSIAYANLALELATTLLEPLAPDEWPPGFSELLGSCADEPPLERPEASPPRDPFE